MITKKEKKIVFLDAATLDLGDLDWSVFHGLGRIVKFPHSAQSEIPTRLAGVPIAVANKCVFDAETIARLPDLKLICVTATGTNNVDLLAAKARGIAVTNVPGYSTPTVAEHTILFLLALSHRLIAHDRAAKGGDWTRSPTFAVLDFPFSDLAGKTLGIVGYGAIGKRVAKIARALGMKVAIAALPKRKYPPSPKRLPLRALLAQSDYVSLHCALSPETRHLIGTAAILKMRKGAALLNLARGPIVDEIAVASALRRGHLAAYAADVLSQEPPTAPCPILANDLKNKVLLTPHIAWASRESRQRLLNTVGQNIRTWQQEKRLNRVA